MDAKIAHMIERIKGWARDPDVAVVLIIILVGLASFALGRLSAAPEKPPVEVTTASVFQAREEPDEGQKNRGDNPPAAEAQELYVGSQNSDKYHLPWCSGAQRIHEENKVWFSSKQEAEAAGYSPAGNCKGI